MTPEQRTVLAHVVVDPEAWLAHATKTLGAEAAEACLIAKVARWQPEHDAAKVTPDYKTRAERQAAMDAADEQQTAERIAARRAQITAREAEFNEKVAAAVRTELGK